MLIFSLSHGIGRSGELNEAQPKAAGSTLLYRITNKLAKCACVSAGLHRKAIKGCIVLPVATGMAINLSLSALRIECADAERKYVLLMRCDQKSAPKAVKAAGLIGVTVENNILNEGPIVSDLENLYSTIQRISSKKILAVISTLSCFAPRNPDLISLISETCHKNSLFHIVNNAYGIQSKVCLDAINECVLNAGRRIDFVVSSTDKNFMVPVGGSIVFSPRIQAVNQLSCLYPGRASIAPIVDLFITLLEMGISGLKDLLEQRLQNYAYLRVELEKIPKLRFISSPENDISIAIAFDESTLAGHFGAELFLRKVSGVRFLPANSTFGQHFSHYPFAYFTVAASIGQSRKEIDLFLQKLREHCIK